jgi:2-dehydro-3-deoxyphosphooctonate aldolase (KDO 8-P synthase)
MEHIRVGSVTIGNDLPFTLIAGPCALESRNHAFEVCQQLKEITQKLNIGFIFKTSFDKANRTSINAHRGIGMEKGLPILAEIREFFGCPVVTDVHESFHCATVAEVVDMLQIPAYLCRQTDLLAAAAATGKALHIKKGQFLAPWDMENVLKKVLSFGNRNILLCERGVSFGYNTLVSDMRSIPIMAKTGFPVIFDATHSVQQPGGAGEKSGGQREFVPILARAAISIGVAGLFIETHPDPDKAPSDGPNMVYLHHLPALLKTLQLFDTIAKQHPTELA